ncbi:receptor-like protein kinase, partial [Trifolium pratense]
SLDLSGSMRLDPFTWKRLILNATNLRQLHLDDVDMSLIDGSSLSQLMNLSSSLVSLSLAQTGLQGNFPSDIISSPNLHELELSSNQNLSGQLPKFNSSTPLRYLDLSYTAFSGEIPYSIGKLKSLTQLTLTECYFDGLLPLSLGNLTQLTSLNLAGNNLKGEIPSSLSKLTHLTYLDLQVNNFSVSELGLSDNQLTGSIGEFSTYSLRYLSLSNNNIQARIQNLQELDLSNNKIQGKVPSWFHEKLLRTWKDIQHIDLSYNKLQGVLPIPPYGIQFFLLSNNNFTGDIAMSLCNASSLNVLNLAHNNLTGAIPQCLGTFPSLSVFDMQMNNLYGSIPRNFSKENSFQTIKLNGNRLEGTMPQSLARCTKLEVLDLGDNSIKDAFPNWLETLQELQVLSLRSNELHGSITCSSTKHPFPKLRIYDVSGNNFSGPLPTSCFKNFRGMMNVIDNKTGLQYMGVANYYNDSVVVTIKGFSIELTRILTTFTTIDLSNNMFEGEIPQVIGELNSLKGLNLSNNGITGNIPQSLSYLRNLEWLDLSRNKLRGEIPMALTKLNFLSFLNFSQNHLEGIIPNGQQFNTFGNDSYEGNTMLCGFPLSKSCKNDEDRSPYSTSNDDEESGFGWKTVVIGYGCGSVFGMLLGYNVFFNGKPQWLSRLVESIFSIRLKRTNNRAGANRRRMN